MTWQKILRWRSIKEALLKIRFQRSLMNCARLHPAENNISWHYSSRNWRAQGYQALKSDSIMFLDIILKSPTLTATKFPVAGCASKHLPMQKDTLLPSLKNMKKK